MDNETFGALLDQIKAASAQLNEAAHEATETIERYEKQLVDAEPGVSVWGDVILEEETTYDNDGKPEAAQRTVTVGFAKVKKKWGFAVREEIKGKKDKRGSFSVPLSDHNTLLRKADRDLRILGVPHLEAVVNALLETLQTRVASLTPAEQEEAGGDVADAAAAPGFEATADVA